MIRFSHEANSWQFKMFSDWINCSIYLARAYYDIGYELKI